METYGEVDSGEKEPLLTIRGAPGVVTTRRRRIAELVLPVASGARGALMQTLRVHCSSEQ